MEIKLLGKLVRATQACELIGTKHTFEFVKIKKGDILIVAKELKEEFFEKFYVYQLFKNNKLLSTKVYPMSTNKKIIHQNDDWSWQTKPIFLSVYFEIIYET